MRTTTTIFLIILSLLASGKAWSQGEGSYSYSETEHFFIERYTDSDLSTDYLTLKHEPPAQWVDGMNSGYYFQFNKAMTEQDFVGILIDELIKPYLGAVLDTLPADKLKEFKGVCLRYQFDKAQRYLGCKLNVPGGFFNRYPQYEPLLYAWAQGVKGFDFTRYKIKFHNEERFGFGELSIYPAYYINWLKRQRSEKARTQ